MKTKLAFFVILLFFPMMVFAQPSIKLSSVCWNAGKVKEGKLLTHSIIISNTGDQLLEASVRAGCSCITLSRPSYKIEPGQKAELAVLFNTKTKQGNVTEWIYFDTNDPGFANISYIIEASFAGTGSAGASVENNEVTKTAGLKTAGIIQLTLFSSPGCSTCKALKNELIPKLAEKYGLKINITALSLDRKENYERFISLEKELDDRENKLPALLIGNSILGGEQEIKRRLENIFSTIKEKGYSSLFEKNISSTTASTAIENTRYLRLLPIIAAGLLDGVNPCAFATIIFFISYLAFAGRGGKEILVTGISFTLAIFSCYTLIGLGASKIIEMLSDSMQIVRFIIKLVTVVMVFILGIMSLYDYIKCRQGKPKEMKLQLSPLLKAKIHQSIVGKRGDFSGKDSSLLKLMTAGFVVGILVSVFEFACTGQIYLPTIIYMLKLPGYRFSALGYLLLYNLMFIVPLIIIFMLAWKGVTSEQFAGIMYKHLSKIKMGMAIFFFGMGLLLIIS